MSDFEQEEIKLIEQIEKREKEREARFNKILSQDVVAFDDRFYDKLNKEIKKKKYKDGKSLKDYFDTDAGLCELPVDFVLKDNVQTKDNVEKIINETFSNSYSKLSKVSKEIKIEKFYERVFVFNYDLMIYVVSTSSHFRGRARGFSSDVTHSILDIKQDQAILGVNHPQLYNKLNMNDVLNFNTQEKFNILKTQKKCSFLSKSLLKNTIAEAKLKIPELINYILSNVNILSLKINHILCPVYKVRFYKKGFDVKYLINANTKKCMLL